KKGILPYVGDEVMIEITDEKDDEGVINEILPRKNSFSRPPIANVDCFVIVISLADPEPNLTILDKFLVMAEKARTESIICINKIDLLSKKTKEAIAEIYKPLYPVVYMSGHTGEGIAELKTLLAGKKSALAGPSGVGKSTLLNRLQWGLDVETGVVSRKTKRGKHTTRHVEIFSMDFGGMIYDTPGFTSFEILDADEDELQFLYPEISKLVGGCKYDNCRHVNEPGCAVVDAFKIGVIHPSRYRSYVSQITEIQEREKTKW
ncbi:MAG: ribosome small subunit-dependent GTPase A, partial [Anaerovorax sp.]